MATSKSLRKFKPGAMVRSKVRPENIYVLDSQGLFHCGHDVITYVDLAVLLNDHPDIYEVISEGVELPAKEPQGLGAVVFATEGNKVEKFVRCDESSLPWCRIDGGWHNWDALSTYGAVSVKHEGWAGEQ